LVKNSIKGICDKKLTITAHFNMGNVKANQGKNKEAAGYFAKALKLNPKDRQAHQNLKKVQELMKNSNILRGDAGN
jgi:TolA-binding protein